MRLRALLAGTAFVAVLASACSGAPTAAPSPQATGATTSPTVLPTVVETINPSAAPTVQPTSPPSTTFTDWTLHPMPIAVPGIYGGNTANAVVRYGGSFVAVGSVNGGCCDGGFSEQTRALVWRSRDGTTWRLVANHEAFHYGRMNAVAANGTRLVAVGYRNLNGIEPLGAAWTSVDGSTWHLVRDVPIFDDVVAAPSGFVAVANSEVGPSIWSSADGHAWRRTVGNDLGSGVVMRLIHLDDGYLMVGTEAVSDHDGYTSMGVIWRSADGTTWERVPDQTSLDRASIHDAAKIGEVYLAIGSSDVEDGGFALISTDGATWRRSTEPPFAGVRVIVDRLMSAHGALVLTGWDPGATTSTFRAWTSTDGYDWAEVRAPRGTAEPGIEIKGWVVVEDGIVAVGSAPRAGEIVAPAAWVIR